MVPILSLILILGVSLVVIRVAAVMLELTGLSRDSARFQARSAFTGVGFTTLEAEDVVSHPVRRSVVMWLMLVGNVGIVSAMAALMVSAIDMREASGFGTLLALIVGGLAFLCLVGSNSWIDTQMCRMIRYAIKRFTTLEPADYAQLLHLNDAYSIIRMRVDENIWVACKTLEVAALAEEGLVVLGIECPAGNFVGAPPSDMEVRIGDEIVVYGSADRIAEFRKRLAGAEGNRAHQDAINERVIQVSGERLRAKR